MFKMQYKLVKIIIPTGGKLTSRLLTSVEKGLKLKITVLQIQLVIRVGIEPAISDSKTAVLTT